MRAWAAETSEKVCWREGNRRERAIVREASIRRLFALSPKQFRRRFKVTKDRFRDLAHRLRPVVDPSDAGKRMAIVSSGGFVPVECKLAVTVTFLARASAFRTHKTCSASARRLFTLLCGRAYML
jgi:hypothetical protein